MAATSLAGAAKALATSGATVGDERINKSYQKLAQAAAELAQDAGHAKFTSASLASEARNSLQPFQMMSGGAGQASVNGSRKVSTPKMRSFTPVMMQPPQGVPLPQQGGEWQRPGSSGSRGNTPGPRPSTSNPITHEAPGVWQPHRSSTSLPNSRAGSAQQSEFSQLHSVRGPAGPGDAGSSASQVKTCLLDNLRAASCWDWPDPEKQC